ncbi:MAG: FliM/FliN family flagellar motor switch protein [Candidatus Thiodiazotropha sp. 6PLUC2]
MKARPYLLIGDRLRTYLRGKLGPIIKDWGKDWLPDQRLLSFGKLTPLSDYCRDGRVLTIKTMVNSADETWCGLLKPSNIERFGAMLTATPIEQLDESKPSLLLKEVALQALTDLAQRILSRTQSSNENNTFFLKNKILPKEATAKGSGAMVIWVKVGDMPFAFFVSPRTVELYLDGSNLGRPKESRTKLVDVRQSLGRQKVKANISLGTAALSISELATIRIGDVVSLDKRINEPSAMKFDAYGTACEGFIGSKGNTLAFRISRIEDKKV